MKVQKLQLDKINTNHIMDDKKYTLLDSEKQPTGEFTGIELKKSNLLFTVGDDKLFLINNDVFCNQDLLLKGYKSHYEKGNTLYLTDTKDDIYRVKRNCSYFQNSSKILGKNSISNIVGENLSLVNDSFLLSYKSKILLINTNEKAIKEYSLNNEESDKFITLPENFLTLFANKTNTMFFSENDIFLNIFFLDPNSDINVFVFNTLKNDCLYYFLEKKSLGIPYTANVLDIKNENNKISILCLNHTLYYSNHIRPVNLFELLEYVFPLEENPVVQKNILYQFSDEDFFDNTFGIGESKYDSFIAFYQNNKICTGIRAKHSSTYYFDNTLEYFYSQVIFYNILEKQKIISSHYNIKKIDAKFFNTNQFRNHQISLNETYLYLTETIQKNDTVDLYCNQHFVFNPNYPIDNKIKLPTKNEIEMLKDRELIEIKSDDPPIQFEFGDEIFGTGKKIIVPLGLEYLLGSTSVIQYYFNDNKVPYWFLQIPKFLEPKNIVINIKNKDKILKSYSYTNTVKWNNSIFIYTPTYNFTDYKLATKENATNEYPIGTIISDYIELGVRTARKINIFVETARGNAVVFEDDNKVCHFLDHNNQLYGVFQGESEEIIDISSIKDGTFIATNNKLLLQTVIGTNAIEYYNQEINIGYDVTSIGDKIICYYSDNVLKYVYENNIIEMLYPLNTPPKKVIKKRNFLLLQDMKNRIWIITPKEQTIALLSLSEEKTINLDHLIKDNKNNIYALEKGVCKFRFSYSRGINPIVLKKVSSYSKIIKAISLLECKNSIILNVVHWRDKFTIPCSIALQRDRTIQINFDERLGNEITIEYI